jgi:ribosome maturation factor RimP
MPNAKFLSPELFKAVKRDVAKHIKKKLLGMEIDVTDLELHNSSQTKTLRVYVTLSRTTNLKALYLAESMVCKELQGEFSMQPHAFYWRYLPADKLAEAEAPAPLPAN